MAVADSQPGVDVGRHARGFCRIVDWLASYSWIHRFRGLYLYRGVVVVQAGQKGLLGFALLFPGIMFATEFSTVRIQEPFVLYRSYMWMPGLFAALPLLSGWLTPKKSYVLLGSLCVIFVPLTLNRVDSFSSNLKLWSDAEKLVRGRLNVFGTERTYYNLGTELGKLKRYDEAVANFDKAIAIQPLISYLAIGRLRISCSENIKRRYATMKRHCLSIREIEFLLWAGADLPSTG